jgi:hypothetical protein
VLAYKSQNPDFTPSNLKKKKKKKGFYFGVVLALFFSQIFYLTENGG